MRTRDEAIRILGEGTTIIVFPAGGVATAPTPFGRAVELPWKLFTARMLQARARVRAPRLLRGPVRSALPPGLAPQHDAEAVHAHSRIPPQRGAPPDRAGRRRGTLRGVAALKRPQGADGSSSTASCTGSRRYNPIRPDQLQFRAGTRANVSHQGERVGGGAKGYR